MNRQEAIDILSTHYEQDDQRLEQALDMAIEALKEPHWIPCKERLPKNSDIVLCSIPADGEYCERIAFCYYQEFGGLGWRKSDWLGSIGKYGEMYPEPVAWMPRPKPYKGGEA